MTSHAVIVDRADLPYRSPHLHFVAPRPFDVAELIVGMRVANTP
jgi:hypothetical protein